jgi:hypothetical protein
VALISFERQKQSRADFSLGRGTLILLGLKRVDLRQRPSANLLSLGFGHAQGLVVQDRNEKGGEDYKPC